MGNAFTTWNMMERYNLPVPGSRVVFKFTPGASYASVDEIYHVGWSAGVHSQLLVSLTRVSPEPRCGTFDSMSAWQYAEWEYDYTTVEKPELKWPRAPFAKKR